MMSKYSFYTYNSIKGFQEKNFSVNQESNYLQLQGSLLSSVQKFSLEIS